MAESKCNGVVLVNAYLRAPGMIRQAERIAEELRLRGSSVRIVKTARFCPKCAKYAYAVGKMRLSRQSG